MTDSTPRIDDCPRTAEGWIPISYFQPEFFEEGDDFLVWLEGKAASPCAEPLAIIDKAQFESGELSDEETGEVQREGPGQFAGEWRYIDQLAHLEPIAFQPLPKLPARATLDALTQALAA